MSDNKDVYLILIRNIVSSVYMMAMLEDVLVDGNLSFKNIDDFYPVDLIRLKVINAILLLALYKEDLVKNKKQFALSEDIIDIFLSNIINEDGTLYRMGDMQSNNRVNLINVLRNKLLHGEFKFDDVNQMVQIHNKGMTANILYNNLIRLGYYISSTQNTVSTGEVVHKAFFIDYKKINRIGSFNYFTLFDKIGEHCYQIEIFDEPEEGYKRNVEYVDCITSFLMRLRFIKKTDNPERQIYYSINEFKRQFEKNHIKIRYEIKKATELSNFEEIKNIFRSKEKTISKNLGIDKKNLLFAIYCMRCAEQSVGKGTLESSILSYSETLNSVMKGDYSNVLSSQISLFPEVDTTVKMTSLVPLSQQLFAMALNVFYNLYQYGLEGLYSKGKEDKLESVALFETMPFDYLDLEVFDDENMTIKDDFSRFYDELESYKESYYKAEVHYNSLLEEIRRLEKNGQVLDDDYREKREILNSLELEYCILKVMYEKLTEFMEKRFHKYVRNYNILHHIRNALSHGNISLGNVVEGLALGERLILIEDTLNGKTTYRKEMEYSEFRKLVSSQNILNVLNYLCKVSGLTLEEVIGEKKLGVHI